MSSVRVAAAFSCAFIEFGRTAAENASGGTDHGTGGLAILAGDWPGLSDGALHEGRDVPAANAYERLFKAVLVRHLGLEPGFVEDRVFPARRALSPMDGLRLAAGPVPGEMPLFEPPTTACETHQEFGRSAAEIERRSR